MHHHGSTRILVTAAVAMFILGTLEVTGEFLWMNSTSLLLDAIHNGIDAVLMLSNLSTSLLIINRRFPRFKESVALATAVVLELMAIYILIVAVGNLGDGEHVKNGIGLIGFGLASLVVNLTIARLLHPHSHHDINARSVQLHFITDAIAAGGVLFAGLLVWSTKLIFWDQAITMVVSLVIAVMTYPLLIDSMVLLKRSNPQ